MATTSARKGPTPRQLAREETVRRIKQLALEQLAESGAGELSLRAIARELNIVSSAIYRYFSSRDELITALIIDAYNDFADSLEVAGQDDRRGAARRWRDTCTAARDWARAEPHRFGLIYGTSIPGYHAPQTTIEPAARGYRAFCLAAVENSAVTDSITGRRLRTQLIAARDTLRVDADEPTMLAFVGAFSRVIGMITLELGGHLVGVFEPADDLFAAVVEREARQLGL